MKVAVKKIDKIQRVLEIDIPAERVNKKFDEVYEDIKKEAKIPGFRPGTAPRNLLEKHHAQFAHEEVLKRLLPETYQEALQQEKLDVLSMPEISEVSLTSGALTYKATVEIKPEITIKSYKKISVKRTSAEVTDEDVKKFLEEIKKARKLEKIDDSLAKGFGYGSLAELKEAVKRQLIAQKEADSKAHLEEQIITHLLKNSEFTVPQSLVNKRSAELQKETEQYLRNNRLSEDDVKKKLEEFKDRLKKQAEEQVKVFLILDEIATKENLQRDDQMPKRAIEFLLQNAEWSEK